MQEFRIRIRSFEEVREFILISTAQPFRVLIGNDHQTANATSYMGLMSLDHSGELRVSFDCSDSEFQEFRRQSARFLAE
jgi:phosphotransferase system HPr-like phosphotransfer protein